MKYVDLSPTGEPQGFYTPEIHGDNIPETCVEITDDQWRELLKNQGERIVDISSGKPEVKPREKPESEILEGLAHQARMERNALLEEADKLVWKAEDKDDPRLPEYRAYRQALRDIPDQEGFPRDIEWPVKPE